MLIQNNELEKSLQNENDGKQKVISNIKNNNEYFKMGNNTTFGGESSIEQKTPKINKIIKQS
jgi:hypothetical protein